ncbi:uncharacterized protein LOC142342483 [Convolutriloba macropyga]|uniref:uncharacterized protein LOC142342483 n=1 Tax=Convolutriloba macropyga TaxID=536237 RepID=UPI003F5261D2
MRAFLSSTLLITGLWLASIVFSDELAGNNVQKRNRRQAFGLFHLSASLKAREQVREMGLEPGDVEPQACLYYEGTTDVLKMCQFVCPGCVHFSRHSPKCLGKECYCCDRYKKN